MFKLLTQKLCQKTLAINGYYGFPPKKEWNCNFHDCSGVNKRLLSRVGSLENVSEKYEGFMHSKAYIFLFDVCDKALGQSRRSTGVLRDVNMLSLERKCYSSKLPFMDTKKCTLLFVGIHMKGMNELKLK